MQPEPCQAASRRQLRSLNLRSEYDLVLLDGDAVAPILDNPFLTARYRILRTHNWEAAYHRERSRVRSSPLHVRAYDLLEARRYPSYTTRVIERCDAIWWVSGDEMADATSGSPELYGKSCWLPHFHDVAAMRISPRPKQGSVLFVGALSSSQNIEAVSWYLDAVHPRLAGFPGYQFVVAGGTDGRSLPKALSRLTADPACSLLRDVTDLRPVYASARVFANPVRHGAGINSKTIHAISEGIPVITTTVGFRGTGLKPGYESHSCRLAGSLRLVHQEVPRLGS